MSDPFQVLKSPDRRVEPDAEFRARVRTELDQAFDMQGRATASDPVAPMVVSVATEQTRSSAEQRSLRYFTLLVAAAAAIVAVAAVMVVRERDASPPPLNEQPPAAETTSTTTVPFDPVGDGLIAESVLLDNEEYAPGVIRLDSNVSKDVVLDRSIAQDVPGCAAFLDTVFESSGRPAVTRSRSFYSSLPALLGEYVVVFPSEVAAQAMFDASIDPTFHTGCFLPYVDLLVARFGDQCCDPNVAGPPPLRGLPIESQETFGADDVSLRLAPDQYYTNQDGVRHGPETFEEATVRVGRAVVIMEAITQDEFGKPVISEVQFHSAIATTVTKARTAQQLPQPGG